MYYSNENYFFWLPFHCSTVHFGRLLYFCSSLLKLCRALNCNINYVFHFLSSIIIRKILRWMEEAQGKHILYVLEFWVQRYWNHYFVLAVNIFRTHKYCSAAGVFWCLIFCLASMARGIHFCKHGKYKAETKLYRKL